MLFIIQSSHSHSNAFLLWSVVDDFLADELNRGEVPGRMDGHGLRGTPEDQAASIEEAGSVLVEVDEVAYVAD